MAIGPDGTLHVVYYDRVDAGDVIRYRSSTDGVSWSAPETVSEDTGRNWGPDIVVRSDGSVVVVYDHAESDFRARGWLRVRDPVTGWSEREPLTSGGAEEVGSGHVANAVGDDLAYIRIQKPLGMENRFRAVWSWRKDGVWSEGSPLSDGSQDAWHTNVERRPDGSVLAGWDVGVGGTGTTLYVANGHDGKFDPPVNLTATSKPGERPNFAFFPDGRDLVTWFRKDGGFPKAVYIREGKHGVWGQTDEPSAGLGGYSFDPDIAVDDQGTWCLVWGWDGGNDAELVYSMHKNGSWTRPRQLAHVGWGKPGLPSIDVDRQGRFHVVWNQGIRGSSEVYYLRLDP